MPTLVLHPPQPENPVVVHLDSARDLMDDDALFDFCQKNELYKIERTAKFWDSANEKAYLAGYGIKVKFFLFKVPGQPITVVLTVNVHTPVIISNYRILW